MTPLIFAIIGITLVVLAIDGLLHFAYKNLWGFNVKDQMRYLLEDTIRLYSVNENRAQQPEMTCRYRTDNLKTCAVGHRFHRYNEDIEGILPASPLNHKLKAFIDPIYREIPMDFWDWLQTLHDDAANWTQRGLTEKGRKTADMIKVKFAL